MKLPEARNRNIVINELEKEMLVYDLSVDKAYNLNETSAIVFSACGKNQTFDDLKSEYKFTDDLIYFALDELQRINLIENKRITHFSGLTRREVIRRVGLASMIALPIVTGLIAPKAVQAASFAALGAPCNDNCAAPNQCTEQFGNPTTICRAPSGQPCTFSRPDLCTSGCCTASAGGPICCDF